MKVKLLFVGLLFSLISCSFFGEGTSELIKEYPNGNDLKVVVFENLGNATVNNSVHVSLKEKDQKLKDFETGNIFIADGIEPFELDSLVIVDWVNDSTVQINWISSLRIFKVEEDITIGDKEITVLHNSRKYE